MWDGVGIIVNAIIGSGIFITPKSGVNPIISGNRDKKVSTF
jgi:hypothetical protein